MQRIGRTKDVDLHCNQVNGEGLQFGLNYMQLVGIKL